MTALALTRGQLDVVLSGGHLTVTDNTGRAVGVYLGGHRPFALPPLAAALTADHVRLLHEGRAPIVEATGTAGISWTVRLDEQAVAA